MAQRIVVTGAAGQAGRAVVADLREHGYDVLATDTVVSGADRGEGMLKADLTDYGQAVEVLSEPGTGAVVHLANIPAPGLSTPAVTFNANMAMNFNVFQAAAAVKLSRVVWASSETIAGHISEWSGIPFVALRFSNIMAPEDYQEWFHEFQDDPHARKWNMWGYIDQRDVAQACRRALEAPAAAVEGSPAFIIAAADTVMNRPSAELLAEVYPQVKLTRDVGEHGTLLAIDRAREVLGFNPAHSWRDHVRS